MALKIKLFALDDESYIPTLIGQVIANETDCYSILRVKLEDVDAADWPFEFRYIEENCRVNRKFKALNVICLSINGLVMDPTS